MNSSLKAFFFITSIVATVVCLAVLSGLYAYVGILPIFFFCFVCIVNFLNSIWTSRPLSSYIISWMLWIRMVLLPVYGALTGVYSSISISPELSQHFIGAVALCLYDCVAIIIVLFFFSTKKDKTERAYITRGLYGRSDIYLIFVLFALALFVTVGRSMDLFDFFIKPITEDLERGEELMGGREMNIRQIISSGLLFLFLIVVAWLKKRYDKTHFEKYFIWSLIFAILFIAVIVGERRTSQLYKAFACGYLFFSLYPRKQKKTVLYIGLSALVILSAMTIYKQFHGFLYSSYAEALQNASMAQGFSYNMIDAYFYGIDTIAKNIHYGQLMDRSLGQFLYDTFRNIFGLNFFVPGGRLISSQIYNGIIYSGDRFYGYLLSSVGYGYLFMGYVLAPVITVFNFLLLLFFEKCLRKSKSIEWTFIWAFAYMRFGFGVLGSTPPLINFVSHYLIINGIVILSSRLFKAKLR